MYEGELVTFKIKDKETLAALSLTEINLEITEEGLLIKKKANDEEIGYCEEFWGISMEDFGKYFGYQLEDIPAEMSEQNEESTSETIEA